MGFVESGDKLLLTGKIVECLRGTEFLVEVDIDDLHSKKVVGYVSGRLRKAYIRVSPGDKVLIELSRFDLNRVRIVKKL